MPQGASESPAIYACMAEELISLAESRLTMNQLPTGIFVPEPRLEHDADSVELAKIQRPFSSFHIACTNFADDTYVLADSTTSLSYSTACIAREFRRTGQQLNDNKCEVICGDEEASTDLAQVRAWEPQDLQMFEAGDQSARLRAASGGEVKFMKRVQDMTILGSCVVLSRKDAADAALRHRCKAAWRSWHILTDQLTTKSTPLRLRIFILDTTVMASLMWGLETVDLTKKRRKKMNALQRTYIGRMIRLCRRPQEGPEAYFRRRERVSTAMIKQHSRGKWGAIQRYRFMGFHGHVARLSQEQHLAARGGRWRDLEWWRDYCNRVPAKAGGQRGRRPQGCTHPCATEAAILKHFKRLCQHSCWDRVCEAVRVEAGADRLPESWQDLAAAREVWRAFARWVAFKKDL